MTDIYRTLAAPVHAELPRIFGSRFLADAFPVASFAEADAHLAALRKATFDATHHCSACRLDPDGTAFRFSDDGEPGGTAGLPIFRQLEGRGLAFTFVVVTRYYGGTKLGTGGLVRAYGDAASLVLDEAEIVERVVRVPVLLRFAYPYTSAAMHVLHRFDTVVAETVYAEDTALHIQVRRSEAEALKRAFVDGLAGRGSVG